MLTMGQPMVITVFGGPTGWLCDPPSLMYRCRRLRVHSSSPSKKIPLSVGGTRPYLPLRSPIRPQKAHRLNQGAWAFAIGGTDWAGSITLVGSQL